MERPTVHRRRLRALRAQASSGHLGADEGGEVHVEVLATVEGLLLVGEGLGPKNASTRSFSESRSWKPAGKWSEARPCMTWCLKVNRR